MLQERNRETETNLFLFLLLVVLFLIVLLLPFFPLLVPLLILLIIITIIPNPFILLPLTRSLPIMVMRMMRTTRTMRMTRFAMRRSVVSMRMRVVRIRRRVRVIVRLLLLGRSDVLVVSRRLDYPPELLWGYGGDGWDGRCVDGAGEGTWAGWRGDGVAGGGVADLVVRVGLEFIIVGVVEYFELLLNRSSAVGDPRQ